MSLYLGIIIWKYHFLCSYPLHPSIDSLGCNVRMNDQYLLVPPGLPTANVMFLAMACILADYPKYSPLMWWKWVKLILFWHDNRRNRREDRERELHLYGWKIARRWWVTNLPFPARHWRVWTKTKTWAWEAKAIPKLMEHLSKYFRGENLI